LPLFVLAVVRSCRCSFLPLFVLAVILSGAKDPEGLDSPQPLEPFQQPTSTVFAVARPLRQATRQKTLSNP